MSIFIANWKANPENYKEAQAYVREFCKVKLPKGEKVVICPPALFLQGLKSLLPKAYFGVQNISEVSAGAHTGEVTAKMAKTGGAEYVIVGHSERRKMGETNEVVAKKVALALKVGLTPILCIGEESRDMDGQFYKNLHDSIYECLGSLPKASIKNIILAYEPVWAIGSKGQVISPEDLGEAVVFLKKVLSDIAGEKITKKVKVIYGGSVNNKNVGVLSGAGVEGFLVGRASLSVKKFFELINKGGERA